MNKHIVAPIHPFVHEQEIYVYINGECVTVKNCTVDNMCDTIYELCEKYDIDRVDFQGGQLYALKFKDEFLANKFGAKIIKVFIH
jgi:hypothetical protein